MSNVTNTLLIVVIVLLVVLVSSNNNDSKNVYAQGAASSDPIIFTVDATNKEIYLIHTEKSIILNYKTSGKGIRLKAARKFDYDVQLGSEFYNGSGESYVGVIKRIKMEAKRKK